MSDLSGLHGVFPTSLRWNAEDGFLGVSIYNPETGERELQEIELGKPATFAMDMATRERGYGLIRVGVYDMRLTPVGSPPPPWPDDEEFKPALGVLVVEPDHSASCGSRPTRRSSGRPCWPSGTRPRSRRRPQRGCSPSSASPTASRSRQVGQQDVPRAGDQNRRLGRARQGAGLVGARAHRRAAQGHDGPAHRRGPGDRDAGQEDRQGQGQAPRPDEPRRHSDDILGDDPIPF